MAVHVLEEHLGVGDDSPIRVAHGGKRGGTPQPHPSDTFPRFFGNCHVVDFLVEEVGAGAPYYIIKDLLIVGEPRVLVCLLGEVAQG